MLNKELWQEAVKLVGEEELSRRFKNWINNLTKVARMKVQNLDAGQLLDEDVKAILDDLNLRTGSRFQPTDNAKAMIRARMQQGYVVRDFLHVHEAKCAKWQGNPETEAWLRPSTLYRPCHFDEYLSEYYAMERQKQELAEKRKNSESQPRNKVIAAIKGQEAELIAELMSKAWWEFESWAELMRWTVQFPTAESLAKYEMPEILKKLRCRPGMAIMAVAGKIPDWAELAYQDAKKVRGVACESATVSAGCETSQTS